MTIFSLLSAARSQEQLPQQDPYNSYRGGPPPQSAGPYSMPGQGYPRDPKDPSRSKSTSNLDQREPDNFDYRQTNSTSTLPRSYPQQPSGPAPQQRPPFDNNRAASQPDLNRREEDPRNNSTYENYPGARPPDKYPQDQYNQPNYVNQNDIRNQYMGPQKGMPPSRSMGSISDQPRPEQGRHKSEELDHSRVREWQQRNEMAEQQKPGFNPYGQSPYPNTPKGPPGPETSRPYDPRQGPPEDNRPKPNLAPKPAGNKPPENRYSGQYQHDPQRPGPGPADYPPTSQTGGFYPPSSQPNHPAASQAQPPHSSQAGQFISPPGGHYPPSSHGYTPTSQGATSPYGQAPLQQTVQSRYQSQTVVERSYRSDKTSTSRLEAMDGKQTGSPDLPPPPSSDMPPDLPPPPPPEDQRGYHPEEHQMPPPPPPAEYEARMREEQMMKQIGRYAGQQDPRQSSRDPMPGSQEPRPEMRRDPHAPTPGSHPHDVRGHPDHGPKPAPPSHRPAGPNQSYSNYQNMPAASSSPYGGMSTTANPMYTQSDSRPQYESQTSQQEGNFSAYPYAPRPAPAEPMPPTSHARDSTSELEKSLHELSMIQNESQNPPPKKKPPPPIKAKPKLVVPDSKKGPSPSPWEREEKEKETRRKEAETRMRRDQEILFLEQKTYLSHEEQERLKRLRLDREFDRRVLEASQKQEDEEETEMAERAAVSCVI